MKFQLVAGHQGTLEIGVGPFAARFEPGLVVAVEDEAFAAHLAGRPELAVVEESEPPATAAGTDPSPVETVVADESAVAIAQDPQPPVTVVEETTHTKRAK